MTPARTPARWHEERLERSPLYQRRQWQAQQTQRLAKAVAAHYLTLPKAYHTPVTPRTTGGSHVAR